MDDMVSRFRARPLPFNAAVSAREIARLQASLGAALPAELLALYRDHDGLPEHAPDDLPFRLMPIDEVIDIHHIARREGWADVGVRVFWTDDNSNYAGLYLTGPLAEPGVHLEPADVQRQQGQMVPEAVAVDSGGGDQITPDEPDVPPGES